MTAGRILLAALLLPVAAWAHDYPTAVRADYVLGCMASNGNTRLALEKCACAIDAIAEQLPFSRYEEAETALRMQAVPLGERGAMFRDPPEIRRAVEALRQAQAEATLRCF
ncbi:hypothetical protein EBE87_21275 [Pseudoroseomonas wenyumeiae]|uniref:Uncharacterized protein n=1 Tax=Teichococcus wenyumeiae TaxID=2478470 RepID=A0A3A9JKD3_9PROT|nr:hypothetical protein [Pseudoroseomonas wenyumeiae]RKK04164.1 hypothetical protein D6Z83_10910 [Pseudoroseomonas wenyumeiae]RMI19274.1 hypothetical protein EBE87_21275 [Pseudoroseomonas wenyumeiae]